MARVYNFSAGPSMLPEPVLKKAASELLTPRGLRTLTPRNPNYIGIYSGTQAERDEAYHQGTVWPWLLGPFCEGWLRVHGQSGVEKVRKIVMAFEEVMKMVRKKVRGEE